MDDTGERKQKKEAKARKAFIEFYQQKYGYVLVPLEEQFTHQREEAEQAIDTSKLSQYYNDLLSVPEVPRANRKVLSNNAKIHEIIICLK